MLSRIKWLCRFLTCLILLFSGSSLWAADNAPPVILYNSTAEDWRDLHIGPREFSLSWLHSRTGWSPNVEGAPDPLVMESCEQFVAFWLRINEVAEVIRKRRDSVDFNRCFAQYFIDGTLSAPLAEEALRTSFSLETPLRDVAERLNLLSFRSSLQPEYYGQDRLLITDMEGHYEVRQDEKTQSVIMENDHWFFQINIIGAGNWVQSGRNEGMLMIEVIDQAKQGTYLDRTFYLLFAPEQEGDFQVFDLGTMLTVLYEDWRNARQQ